MNVEQMPPDPSPNLTIVGLDELDPQVVELPYLQVIQDLFPDRPIVLLAEIVERHPDGRASLRLLP